MKIYLGSVWEDLEEEQQAIVHVLHELGADIEALQVVASHPGKKISECLAEVASSQVFIGILGHSYRPVEPEQELSRAELEYLKALEAGVPRLMYFKSEEVPIPMNWIETKPDLRAKLGQFKSKVSSDEPRYFSSKDDLARQIVLAVSRLVILSKVPSLAMPIGNIVQAVSRGVVEEIRQTLDRPLRALRPQIFRPVNVDVDRQLCFVLMPQVSKAIYKDHLRPTVEQAGLNTLSEDELVGTGLVQEDIWEQIHRANIIIGDLTGADPAVYYWIGVCHAIGKHMILISQSEVDISIPLRRLHCIIYQFTPQGVQALQDKLLKTVRLVYAD